MKKINNQLLNKAIKEYGVDSQLDMTIEECAELIHAIQKLKKAYGKEDEGEKIIALHGEIADVEIMIAQLRLIFDPKLIDQSISAKMHRLEKRLSKDWDRETKV